MTNETTASQPKSLSAGIQHAMYQVAQRGESIERMHAAVMAVINSQPKSIGDDAQFARLMGAYIDARQRKNGSSDVSAEFDALASYIDNFRAPAAQASATIQAAPEARNNALEEAAAKCEDIYSWRGAFSAGQLCTRTINACAAAIRSLKGSPAVTIQEPVMVAEPVGEAKPYSCETGQIDEALANFLVEHTRLNQDGIDEHAMTMTLALNYAAINPTPADDIARWYEQGYLSDAAPMVADPASVALTYPCWSCKKPYTLDQRSYADGRCPHCDVDIDLDLEMDDEADDATVKAVPSEALAYRVGWFWSSANPDRAVRCLAEGKQIAEYEKRDDFIYWCDAAPLADKTDGAVEVSKRTHSARRFEADPMCNETLLAPGTTEVHDE